MFGSNSELSVLDTPVGPHQQLLDTPVSHATKLGGTSMVDQCYYSNNCDSQTDSQP